MVIIMKRRVISSLLVISLMLCSCSRNKTDVSDYEAKTTPIVLNSKVTAPALTYEDDDTYFHYVYKAYSLDGDYDLSYDSAEHKIVGKYENINFDMNIYTDEENLPDVGVYEAAIWCDKFLALKGFNDTSIYFNWNYTGFADEYAAKNISGIKTDFANEDNTIYQIFNSAELVDISEMSVFDDLRNKSVSSYGQELYPTALHYFIDADDVMISSTNSDAIDYYMIRTEFNGLPLSYTYSTMASKMISWDADKIAGSVRDYNNTYYSQLNEIAFSYITNKINVKNVIEEGLTVIPIEDCIMSAISQILYDTSDYPDAQITVLSAELTYCSALELYWNSHVKNPTYGIKFEDYGSNVLFWLFPTWSIYYAVQSEDGYKCIGTVFINPVTGEGMEIDISDIVIMDVFEYPSSVNRFDVMD